MSALLTVLLVIAFGTNVVSFLRLAVALVGLFADDAEGADWNEQARFFGAMWVVSALAGGFLQTLRDSVAGG